jgi:hypothetical protein
MWLHPGAPWQENVAFLRACGLLIMLVKLTILEIPLFKSCLQKIDFHPSSLPKRVANLLEPE